MKIRPLGARVLVKVDDADKTTAGGIVLPDVALGKPQRGKVVAVGQGNLYDHTAGPDQKPVYKPVHVKVGDEVLVAKYANADVGERDELKGHYLVDERDVLCVIEK